MEGKAKNKYLLCISSVLSITVLASCASLSKEECLTGNWEAIGFADGAAGRTAKFINNHNKACAKVGIAANYQIWERGRQQGLKQYCTETNAYNVGRRGLQLSPVCPAASTPRLEQINNDGRRYYTLTRELQTENEQLKKYLDDYEKLKDGDNLHFDNERDARQYMIGLLRKIRVSEERAADLRKQIKNLEVFYGY